MDPTSVTGWSAAIEKGGIITLLLIIIVGGSTVVLKGLLITKVAHDSELAILRSAHEQVITELKGQLGQKDDRITDITRLLTEAREAAQKRGDLLHTEKEALLLQLRENTQQLYRFTDVLADIREAMKEMVRR
jgi:hypothetical protein